MPNKDKKISDAFKSSGKPSWLNKLFSDDDDKEEEKEKKKKKKKSLSEMLTDSVEKYRGKK